MRRIVIDPSGLLTWFDGAAGGRSLRSEYEQGLLGVISHRDLTAHTLDALAASRQLPTDHLVRVAAEVDRLGFELREPSVVELSSWLERGLSVDQAGYAALATSLDLRLVTADQMMLRIAATVARSPADG